MAENGQVGVVEIQKVGQRGVAGDGAGSTAAEKVLAMAGGLRERVMALPVGKRNWLLASVAFLAAICAGMVWFAGRHGLEGSVQRAGWEGCAAGVAGTGGGGDSV